MNNLYISPEFEIIRVEICKDILMYSVEDYSTYVDPNPGDWGDPEIPSDEDITW